MSNVTDRKSRKNSYKKATSPEPIQTINSDPSSTITEAQQLLESTTGAVSVIDFKKMLALLLQIVGQQQTIIHSLQVQQKPKDGDGDDSTIDAETKERKRSLVIYGMPESKETTGRGKFLDDKSTIGKLLDVLDVECEPTQIYRMGNPKNDKPRLVKVVLPSSYYKSDCLKNAKKLKTSEFTGVFIRPSMTKAERDADFLLRQQLREAIARNDGKFYFISKGQVIGVEKKKEN